MGNRGGMKNWSNGSYWGGIRRGDDNGSWSTVGGSGFVGVDDSSETVSISYVVNSSGSAVNVLDGVRTLFVSMGIADLRTRIAGTKSVDNIITKSVVAISLEII